MEAVTMFPNSVNAPSPIVIKDKLHRIERQDQISRQLNDNCAGHDSIQRDGLLLQKRRNHGVSRQD
jgi:hypothetical protein